MMYSNFNNLREFDLDKLLISLTHSDIRNIELHYRGEGDNNLVMSIPEIKYVLRFHKSRTAVDPEAGKEYLKIVFIFQYIMVKCAFSTMYSNLPIFIELPLSETKSLDELVFTERPESRKHKHIGFNIAEMYPDFAFFPMYDKHARMVDTSRLKQAPETDYLNQFFSQEYTTTRNFAFSFLTDEQFRKSIVSLDNENRTDTWCVEIKPKRAWIPSPDRQEMCTFCMNQFHKLETHKIDTRSYYCPMDLFSGNSSRMQHAIKELLKTPQNNLRIFRNGEQVFGDACSETAERILTAWFEDNSFERCTNNFCHLLTEALLYESQNEEYRMPSFSEETLATAASNSAGQELVNQNLCQLKCHRGNTNLPKKSILNRILSLQMLDTVGLQAASDFYLNHKSEYSSEFGYVYDLCSGVRLVNGELQIPKMNPPEAYALATMANDLSILIAMKPFQRKVESVSEFIIEDLRNVNYEVKVSVVDVNPKSVLCIKKHLKRNENLLNSFLKYKEK